MADELADAGHTNANTDTTYFIETYLRQRGLYKMLLLIDSLVLREDLSPQSKAAQLQEIIQGAFNGDK